MGEKAVVEVAPYGTWASPVSAELAGGASRSFMRLELDGGELYWLEARPLEGGRTVLVRADGSAAGQTITPEGFNVRSRVHEYGGGSVLVDDGKVFFTNFADQALYVQELSDQAGAPSVAAPRKITRDDGLRYADCDIDRGRNRLICVREDHRGDGEAVNELVSVALDSGPVNGDVLWSHADFVAYPRLNRAGSRLAWISWDHPNMPWDSVALWVADVGDDGAIANSRRLNSAFEESVLQPVWDDDGVLYVLSDRGGWWNLYKVEDDRLVAVHELDAELGGPLWGLGADFYALVGDDRALIEFHSAARSGIGLLSLSDGTVTPFDLPFAGFASLKVRGPTAYMLAGRDDGPGAIIEVDLRSGEHKVVADTGPNLVADGYISRAQPVEFATAGGGAVAYAYYYPPTNVDFEAPRDEAPPLMVLMHGGPTGGAGRGFSIAKQFWTSRGFAIIDVNYRGSTGFGRRYRELLRGEWGVVDLEDAVAATQYLVEQGLADPDRLLIRGGSAGGYTTLSALAFTDVFAAGANYYGVSDLEALALHTHKFESRYLDSMIGPYPEAIETYKARSPIYALDGFSSPLITFQGLEDQIVPPAQSEKIYNAVKEKGTATAYIAFAGEQHGFRKAENNVTALESELYFYGRVLGFQPAGELPVVAIDNLIE